MTTERCNDLRRRAQAAEAERDKARAAVDAVLALADEADAATRYLWPLSLAEHARGQLNTDEIRAAVAAHVDTNPEGD